MGQPPEWVGGSLQRKEVTCRWRAEGKAGAAGKRGPGRGQWAPSRNSKRECGWDRVRGADRGETQGQGGKAGEQNLQGLGPLDSSCILF